MKPFLIALVALTFAIASAWIERFGPDHAVYCALGKSADGYDIWCPEPVLNGGWPAPYLYDNAGISVERQLGFFEDSFRLWPFISDWAFFALFLRLADILIARLRGTAERLRTKGKSSPP